MVNQQTFDKLLLEYKQRVDLALEHWLPADTLNPVSLHQAMRYSVLGSGKRVRPVLVYATASTLGIPLEKVDGIAAAIEIIHAYSLIHDDLPAMDDDDLRRGKPTCHKQFDEATAILAGDALQALSFYILTHDPEMTSDASRRLEMIEKLALFSGSRGMAGGQAIDLASVGKEINITELETMHIHKTGALIRTCIQTAALTSDTITDTHFEALDCYAKKIGLSFQVQDDILDVISDTETLGKPQGSDAGLDKPTFPAIMGLQPAREKALELHQQALEAINCFGAEADILRSISHWFVQRRH
ncbi:MAG: (2E,6E)-farnesyl diphosphate synthase [Gammaproteobacteria bacterium]|jgi:farnesyl diphosphate synthase|nr:(2E,6E)-farnesyl diphosphate synthase [Gammaproteobacteria bacterium]MBT3723318.1 (2E,6E)-farnesyl diphosphate synthase [Gammaproteobacteria bacterium]MBT4075616.1 (2E,6E)-farnesyl diphosphate synthase [Gammaproteobacteria bacterium]MBT4194539.1 (2E,6E)-farnesyl diphosphate synthase [Gammaproteobacteria bacterium]MBT4449776.1 (2E,6E)-farnesyl diphosphate synthase [Gammaproteobacteria bacterium]